MSTSVHYGYKNNRSNLRTDLDAPSLHRAHKTGLLERLQIQQCRIYSGRRRRCDGHSCAWDPKPKASRFPKAYTLKSWTTPQVRIVHFIVICLILLLTLTFSRYPGVESTGSKEIECSSQSLYTYLQSQNRSWEHKAVINSLACISHQHRLPHTPPRYH